MAKKQIQILVALPSILYAPVYVFQETQRKRGVGAFRFHVDLPHNIAITSQFDVQHQVRIANQLVNLDAFAPIVYDPLFSPIADVACMATHPNVWFGVGDPVRLRRMTFQLGSNLSYRLIGTLVDKLAYWVVAEKKCRFESHEISRYNLVACHSRGMTGYHVADHLFGRSGKGNIIGHPLAPVIVPGSEVDYYFDILRRDQLRRPGELDPNDPVWMAVITTEIGQIYKHRERIRRTGTLAHGSVFERFRDKLKTEDFIMTSIVARKYTDVDNQAKVELATVELQKGIIDAIDLFHSNSRRFAELLASFYRQHWPTFCPPDANGPADACALFEQYSSELKSRYSGNLRTNDIVRDATDALLRKSIASDLRHCGSGWTQAREDEIIGHHTTATWGPNDEW